MGELISIQMQIAIGLLTAGFLLRGYMIVKRKAKKSVDTTLKDATPNGLGDLRTPVRSAEDYWQATDHFSQSFSKEQERTSEGRTLISGFAGAPQYVWDGQFLSTFAGQPLLRMDDQHISDLRGNKKFTWHNGCLSIFEGKKLYTVSSGIVSVIGKGPLYRYDETSVSEFGGSKILSMNGDVEVPDAMVGVLVVMLRNFTDLDE